MVKTMKRNISMSNKRKILTVLKTLSGFTVGAIFAFPILWLFITSFKTNSEIFANPPTLIPMVFSLQQYKDLFGQTSFLLYFGNSMVVAVSASLAGVIVGVLGVYSLSRFKFKGTGSFNTMILIAYMLPQVLIAISLIKLFAQLGLIDSLFGLIILILSITIPFSIWMLKSYIETIPIELEEAAMVDGATRFKAFYKIIVPAAIPGIIATGIFTFIIAWNSYLYALIVIQSEGKKTVSLGLVSIVLGKTTLSYGLLAAGSIVSLIPLLILFTFTQGYLVSGFTAGAVKG